MDYLDIRKDISEILEKNYGKELGGAGPEDLFRASAQLINEILKKKNALFLKKAKDARKVHYLCMEFLVGRSLRNNLYNLGLEKEFAKLYAECGFSPEEIFEREPDAGLGNGGLGRLAACFLDALASGNYPAVGHSLLYEYGIFRQIIEEHNQKEAPDIWLPGGDVWLSRRDDLVCSVRFGGDEIEAVPYDMLISGAGGAVSVLRLWRARDTRNFNFQAFSAGKYSEALKGENEAAALTKLLYPADEHREGKLLRLKQQYFLVSVAVQNIVTEHLRRHGEIRTLPEHAFIHINDTHPALSVPELVRILVAEHGLAFSEAWELTRRTVAYTNHTVMAEALERWRVDMVRELMPRIYEIILEIDASFRKETGLSENKIRELSVIGGNEVRMANLCVIASRKVNGVSKLHSEIIRTEVFGGYSELWPDKFINVTNGIAHRRWLCQANPRLASLLESAIGPGFKKDGSELLGLLPFRNDDGFLEKLEEVKAENKRDFSEYVHRKYGLAIDPASRFDVHVKRFHEYKRQLLNVLKIIVLFMELEDDPSLEKVPETFIFGGKAAPSYRQVKEVIELICHLQEEIFGRPEIREKLNIVFLEDYKVSLAERLIPAAEVSEQISLAGKEASGTGNMKFMINGALTLGTFDGANVEIFEEVGAENIFIFGMRADEARGLKAEYRPAAYLSNPLVKKIIDRLNKGFNNKSFRHISEYLLKNDRYMVLADLEDYLAAHRKMDAAYRNRKQWNRMALENIARAGVFSADRSVREYAEKIWGLKAIE
jgi:starch phosphorylase